MTLRQYMFTMLFATMLCWTAWFFVLTNVDPFQTTTLGFVFFYVSLGLALLGSISLIAFLIYRLFASKDLPLFRYVQISFRQSFYVTCFIVLFLILQGNGYLTIINGTILGLIFIIFISLSISLRRTQKNSFTQLDNQ
ncbi:MAG: hypothetical protein WCW16_00060 [Candidatus Magasanikbacteria bacterium]